MFFSDFMLIFAMSWMFFLFVLFCSTKISEKSDMTKSLVTLCFSGTYNKCFTNVLRNLAYFVFLQLNCFPI